MFTETNNLLFGKVLVQLPQTDSTNSYAKQLLTKSKPAEGTAIIAYQQTQGRGQFGNTWHTEAGKNLILSVIAYPRFVPAATQFDLSRVVALAVQNTLEEYLTETVNIKWPNDVYSSGKKLSGILIENTLQGPSMADSVMGIGINVNQHTFPETLQQASSMCLLEGKEFELNQVFHTLMGRMEYWYMALRNGQTDRIRAAYLDCLYQYHEVRNYLIDGLPVSGIIMGVLPSGELEVSIDGAIRRFLFKEIGFI